MIPSRLDSTSACRRPRSSSAAWYSVHLVQCQRNHFSQRFVSSMSSASRRPAGLFQGQYALHALASRKGQPARCEWMGAAATYRVHTQSGNPCVVAGSENAPGHGRDGWGASAPVCLPIGRWRRGQSNVLSLRLAVSGCTLPPGELDDGLHAPGGRRYRVELPAPFTVLRTLYRHASAASAHAALRLKRIGHCAKASANLGWRPGLQTGWRFARLVNH